jgi:hypothetical protein
LPGAISHKAVSGECDAAGQIGESAITEVVGAFLSLHRTMSGGHPVIGTSSTIAKPLLAFRR